MYTKNIAIARQLTVIVTSIMILLFSVSTFPWQAVAAERANSSKKITAQKKTAQQLTRKRPVPVTNNSLSFLETKFTALANDTVAGKLRHNWIQLENQFAKHTHSDRAAFFQARCKEELADRSFSTADHNAAIKNYQQMAMKWPKSALAPKALFRASVIAYQKIKNKELARNLAKKLSDNYPLSNEKKDIEELLGKAKQLESSNKRPSEKKKLAEQLGLTAKTVMLDAGHGGKDPGAKANAIIERILTLKTVLLLGKELKKKGFTVLYTRTSDTYLALNERTELANKKNVDIFISIHANANADNSISGLETYYFDAASNSSAAKVAARENSVSVKELSNLQFILTDLMLDSKTQESKALATRVHQSILARINASTYKSLYDHGVRTAPFYVLMGARMPAILIEIGYLSNKSEALRLKNDGYLTVLSQAIASGIASYRESITQSLR